jgi:DNA repair protein RecN (Recombination protein N)
MDDLNGRIDLLANAEDVKEAAILGVNTLDEQENNVLDRLVEIQSNWPQAVRNNPEIAKINERLETVIVELKELVSDLRNLTNAQDSEPEELEQLNSRMTEIQLLLRKHRMQSDEELLNFKDDLDNKLLMVDTREQEIVDLQKDIESIEKNAREQAAKLHTKRLSEAQKVVGILEEKLKLLGLPHAQIEIKVSEKPNLNSFGYSELQLLFSANKGARLEEVQKSASGGEVSRLMLVLKSQLARHRHLPTVIFDEIDTGVSGEVGLRMGEMMEDLSHDLQVISITHLPQIASRGEKHFSVYKSHEGVQSQTEVVALAGESRILEIAKMLSGNVPTDGALANARELLGGG